MVNTRESLEASQVAATTGSHTGSQLGHEHPVDPPRVARARIRGLSAEDAGRLCSLLSLLADPVRSRILYALDQVEELCVGDLALALEATEDSVGYGLRLLRTAGLVVTRKAGRIVYYRLGSNFPEPLREHCLRQLVAMTRAAADVPEADEPEADEPEADEPEADVQRIDEED